MKVCCQRNKRIYGDIMETGQNGSIEIEKDVKENPD
jgi:hypothetical protein